MATEWVLVGYADGQLVQVSGPYAQEEDAWDDLYQLTGPVISFSVISLEKPEELRDRLKKTYSFNFPVEERNMHHACHECGDVASLFLPGVTFCTTLWCEKCAKSNLDHANQNFLPIWQSYDD